MLCTSSWDDGHASDAKVAAMLEHYGWTGTFYVCPKTSTLTHEQIRSLARLHEVGAHSMTHPALTHIPVADARLEIAESKHWVERITGEECSMFCYPFGDENAAVRSLVREAGFRAARTVEQLSWNCQDLFGLPTTLQIYPFPWRRRWKRWRDLFDPLARLRTLSPGLKPLRLPWTAYTGWLSLAKALFLHAQRTQRTFFHLWGHSAEIEHYHMWHELEAFLAFTRSRGTDFRCAANGRLLPAQHAFQ